MNGKIKMENRQYFRPTVNEIYTNKNGSQYICLSADRFDAEMINTTSKWRFKALRCQMLMTIPKKLSEWSLYFNAVNSPKAIINIV